MDLALTVIVSLLAGLGAGVGLVCGSVGAGGGMMILLVLVTFLGYAMKEAVGTSVFIMAFTAFVGPPRILWSSASRASGCLCPAPSRHS